MRLILSAIFFVSWVTAASAVSMTYAIFDHDRAAVGAQNYGLRLDGLLGGLNPNAAEFWSFEDMAGNSKVKLTVDVANGTGSVAGQMRRNSDNSIWDLALTLTGVVSFAGNGAAANDIDAGANSFGATDWFGTLTGAVVFDLIGKDKNINGVDYQWTFFEQNPSVGGDFRVPNISAGWVSTVDGGSSMLNGTNDFIGQMQVVPLPASVLLLLSGLGGLGVLARRRRAA